MKINSVQFKRKSSYYLPFVVAIYYNSLGVSIMKIDIVFADNSKNVHYLPIDSYLPNKPFKSMLFTVLDSDLFGIELNNFVTFLFSCNVLQLIRFLNLVISLYPDCVSNYFKEQLSVFVGDNKSKLALKGIM